MKKIKLRLTSTQLHHLHRLFVDHIIDEKPDNNGDMLIQLHLLDIYKKLRDKVESRFTGQGFSITLDQKQAIAYYEYFIGRDYGRNYTYEMNFIKTHIALIDKTYA